MVSAENAWRSSTQTSSRRELRSHYPGSHRRTGQIAASGRQTRGACWRTDARRHQAKRRGRKSMGAKERLEVLERMKRYWANQRRASKDRSHEQTSHSVPSCRVTVGSRSSGGRTNRVAVSLRPVIYGLSHMRKLPPGARVIGGGPAACRGIARTRCHGYRARGSPRGDRCGASPKQRASKTFAGTSRKGLPGMSSPPETEGFVMFERPTSRVVAAHDVETQTCPTCAHRLNRLLIFEQDALKSDTCWCVNADCEEFQVMLLVRTHKDDECRVSASAVV